MCGGGGRGGGNHVWENQYLRHSSRHRDTFASRYTNSCDPIDYHWGDAIITYVQCATILSLLLLLLPLV